MFSDTTIYVMIFVSEAIGSRSSGFIVNTTVPVSRLTIKMDLLLGSVSVSQTKPSSGCTGSGEGVASALSDVSPSAVSSAKAAGVQTVIIKSTAIRNAANLNFFTIHSPPNMLY